MEEDKKKLWKQAIKWPLYSVAILPVLITGAYIINQYGSVKIYNLIAFTFAAIFILLWENLTNDLFDAETGIDEFKFHSIVNLVKNKNIIGINNREIRMLSTNFCYGGEEIYEIENLKN